jgi:hypothetical protein
VIGESVVVGNEGVDVVVVEFERDILLGFMKSFDFGQGFCFLRRKTGSKVK